MQALCPSLSTGGLCLSPHFRIRLRVPEPGEEKNRLHRIELRSGVSDKMHVKQTGVARSKHSEKSGISALLVVGLTG